MCHEQPKKVTILTAEFNAMQSSLFSIHIILSFFVAKFKNFVEFCSFEIQGTPVNYQIQTSVSEILNVGPASERA